MTTRESKYISVLTAGLYFMSKKVPYVFGGEDEKGMDCSGLMQTIFAPIGVKLPRVSKDQIKHGTPIKLSEIQPGDLVGFDINDRNGKGIEHIGMAIGGDLMLHTATPAEGISIVNYKTRYGAKLVSATRVI